MARILVAYATKHHSTEEIAQAIADVLREHGHDVDCADAGDATAAGYGAVILGSAVYMGRWRREAKGFLRRERDRLALIPFWIFSSGPVGEPTDDLDDAKWLEPEKVIETAQSLNVREHVVFGGRMPTEPHGFIEGAMARSTPPEFQDRRDWDEIRAWAARIAAQL